MSNSFSLHGYWRNAQNFIMHLVSNWTDWNFKVAKKAGCLPCSEIEIGISRIKPEKYCGTAVIHRVLQTSIDLVLLEICQKAIQWNKSIVSACCVCASIKTTNMFGTFLNGLGHVIVLEAWNKWNITAIRLFRFTLFAHIWILSDSV